MVHILEAQGLLPEHITILVATGTHRAGTPAEKISMFSAETVQRYLMLDHSTTDTTRLRFVARTASGTVVC